MVATKPKGVRQTLVAAKDIPDWVAGATGGAYRPAERTVVEWFTRGVLTRVKVAGRTFVRVEQLTALISGDVV